MSQTIENSILDSFRDPVYICSDQFDIEYANEPMIRIMGKDFFNKKCYESLYNFKSPCMGCPANNPAGSGNSVRETVLMKDKQTYQIATSLISKSENERSLVHIFRDVTELVSTRKQAEKNEKKYRLLAENAVDVIWQMDPDLKLTYVSPSVRNVLGYDPRDVIGKKFPEFTDRPETMKLMREAIRAIKASGKVRHTMVETRVRKSNGKYIPMEMLVRFLIDESGELTGFQGSARDITDRISARTNQRKQEILMRSLIDNIPDQIYIKDRESRFVINNKAHQEELGGNSQESLVGKTDFDCFDEENARQFYEDEQKILQTGKAMVNKEEYKTYLDGTSRWTLTTKVPIRDEQGEIIYIAGINRDITRRKTMEDELIRSRYELSVRNKIAGIFLTGRRKGVYSKLLEILMGEFDSEFGFLGYLNERGNLFCPSVTEGNYGEYSTDELNHEIPEKDLEYVLRKSLKQKSSQIRNMDIKFFGGRYQLKNVLCVPVFLGKEPIGLIILANKLGGYKNPDKNLMESIVSYIAPILSAYLNEEKLEKDNEKAYKDLQVAKEMAEESDKLKSAFLLNLSHEVRTPLNAIMGFSRLMADFMKGNNKMTEYSSHIDSAGRDLLKMIEDTIDMAKLENGQVRMETESKDVVLTLNEIFNEFKDEFDAKRPDLEFCLDMKTDRCVIETDHDNLKKVVFKLLDNAGKFTKSGRITLGFDPGGDSSLVIYVEDTGIGISEGSRDNIFEKFYKIEGKQVLYRGNGLGLAIAKGLLDVMGGTIHIDSEPGRGTKASIVLPVHKN